MIFRAPALALATAVLVASSAASAKGAALSYDEGPIVGDPDKTLTITTDAPDLIEFELRTSKVRNDTTCADPYATGAPGSVRTGRPFIEYLPFVHEGSPSRALYEWHICVTVGGVTYRAWRGYDPGPGSKMAIHCDLTAARLKARDTTTYLCEPADVAPNPANFGEYRSVCPEGARDDQEEDPCRHFATKEIYDAWAVHNPASQEDVLAMAEAVLDYGFDHKTYLASNAPDMTIYLSVADRDPPASLLSRYAGKARLRPGSSAPAPSRDMETVSPNMSAALSGFEIDNDGLTAKVTFSAYCGSLCATHETYTLRKENGVWRVVDYRMDWIS